jgi:hypothetical protein
VEPAVGTAEFWAAPPSLWGALGCACRLRAPYGKLDSGLDSLELACRTGERDPDRCGHRGCGTRACGRQSLEACKLTRSIPHSPHVEAHGRRHPGRRPKGIRMSERFTEVACDAVIRAQEEAGELQDRSLGTEHLLLGVLAEGRGVGPQVLAELGVNREDLRRALRGSAHGRTRQRSTRQAGPRSTITAEESGAGSKGCSHPRPVRSPHPEVDGAGDLGLSPSHRLPSAPWSRKRRCSDTGGLAPSTSWWHWPVRSAGAPRFCFVTRGLTTPPSRRGYAATAVMPALTRPKADPVWPL